jgi:EAL and modified HD-GYP domain-containing signal transduction protein
LGEKSRFFFCRPELLAGKELIPSRLAVLRLLTELNRADVDFTLVEQIIKQDPPLSLKVIAYLNSALFGWQYEVTSIRRAVLLLGLTNLRRWVSLFAIASLSTDRPFELFRTCLIRARFCELLGRHVGLGANELDLFLIGLLSSLDALLGRPLEELLEQLAVAENVRQALMSDTGPLGPVHAVVRAYEREDWEDVTQAATALGLADGVLVEAYVQALQWAADTAAQVQQACG